MTTRTPIRSGALATTAMLSLFSLLLTIGFWLRHGQWIWEALGS